MMFAEGKSVITERNFIDNIMILWYYFSNHKVFTASLRC